MKGRPVVNSGVLRLCLKPKHVAVMAEPVSVCHQLFRTGTLNVFSIQFLVSISQCSPAIKMERSDFNEYLRPNVQSGSTRRNTRKAVGTENNEATRCCSIILKRRIEYINAVRYPNYIKNLPIILCWIRCSIWFALIHNTCGSKQ